MTEGVHFLDARAPEGMRLYAIGDIHGRRDLIERMHGAIGEDLARDPPADWRDAPGIIFDTTTGRFAGTGGCNRLMGG